MHGSGRSDSVSHRWKYSVIAILDKNFLVRREFPHDKLVLIVR